MRVVSSASAGPASRMSAVFVSPESVRGIDGAPFAAASACAAPEWPSLGGETPPVKDT